MKSSQKMVEVYRARNELEAQVIKGLLESYDIPCYLKGNAAHSVHMFTMDGMSEVKIMVLESQVDEAMELINTGGQDQPEGPDEQESG